jgi:Flp pilus assembly protein TadG
MNCSTLPRICSPKSFAIVRKMLARDHGSSMVEFALVAPMVMVLITGMFCFGIGINNYMILTNAVGAGARALSLTRNQTTPALAGSDPCAYAVQVANQSAVGLNTSAITYSITWIPATGSPTTYSTASCSGAAFDQGDTVQVKAVYALPIAVYGWSRRTANLTSQTAELMQ